MFMVGLDTAFLSSGIHVASDMFWLNGFSLSITENSQQIFFMSQIVFLCSRG